MKWEGKTVWVTGASSGIGAAVARAVSARGATVVATARREDALGALESSCPGTVHAVPADLANIEGLSGLVGAVADRTEGVDVLVLAAGVSQRSAAVETDPSVTETLFRLNVLSQIELCRLVLPSMIARGSGIVVPVTSLAGKAGFPLRSSYCATKHALHGYFEALRAETAEAGVAVTIAVPGFVRTEISRNALQGDGTTYGRMDENQASGMRPERCAEIILRAVERGALEVRPGMGLRGRLATFLHTVAPRVFARMIRTVRRT